MALPENARALNIERIEEILSSECTQKELEWISVRYGLFGKEKMEPSKIAIEMGLRGKKLEKMLQNVDSMVYKVLKQEDLLTILNKIDIE